MLAKKKDAVSAPQLLMMMLATALLLLLYVTSLVTAATTTDATASSTIHTTSSQHINMNAAGGEYKIANNNNNMYKTNYHEHEYFEIYSPVIKTRYSEVYWRFQQPISLPSHIIQRFANGKIMAVTGYEVNQVMNIIDNDGTQQEVPVPITWAYNHHYIVYLSNSNKTRLVKRNEVDPEQQKYRNGGGGSGAHHHQHGMDDYYWTLIDDDNVPEENDENNNIIPLLQAFSEGNGGEFRMSYHGYPHGYGQLIESPDTFISNPMHIDTWNRNYKNVSSGAFHADGAPLPQTSSRTSNIAGYSGLIECPCSTRLPKQWGMSYDIMIHDNDDDDNNENDSSCKKSDILNAHECFVGARLAVQAKRHVNHETVADPTKPLGCSVEQHVDGTVDIVWNSPNTATATNTTSGTKKYRNFSSSSSSSKLLIAYSHAQINTTIVLTDDIANITIVGPANVWFGIAFGSSSMCIHTLYSDECPEGGPYAIIVRGNIVTERKLGFHGIGEIIETSITVVSNTVNNSGNNNNRTVVLTRPVKAATPRHYQFNVSTTNSRSVPIITARGCSLEFAQHCGHGPSNLNFLAVNVPTRICQAGIQGTIGGNWFDNDRCGEPPKSDVKRQNNTACHVQTYRGGMTCCRDGHFLLDAEQDIPWPDEYLEFRLKFRFYFQDYHGPAAAVAASSNINNNDGDDDNSTGSTVAPASHENLIRFFMQTEYRSGEYDIEPCPAGTPPQYCVHLITSRWKVSDMMVDCSIRVDASWCTGTGTSDPTKIEGIKLIYIGPHCHAPSCLSMELYNADTGQLLCHSEPIQGQTGALFLEKGFIAIAPCLFGYKDEGLPLPQLLTMNTTLLLIKKNNSTYPHTGEMAYWQMRGVVVPKAKYGATTTSSAEPQISPSLVELAESRIDAVYRGEPRHEDAGA